MHIYIDDSGCGGFRFDPRKGFGSSDYFVLAACIFREPAHISDAVALMNTCAGHNGMKLPEFKHTRMKKRPAADCLFNCIGPAEFSVRALVVNKHLIWSSQMKKNAVYFKRRMHEQLLTHTFETIQGAKVFIDGDDSGPAGFPDAGYYRQAANRAQPGSVAQVRFVDSMTSRPIQLADMVAGAIRRAEENPGDRQAQDHLASFRARTYQPNGSYWRFK